MNDVLEPIKQQPKRISPKDINLAIRLLIAVILFIFGFNFSNSYFFREFPLFGIRYLAELVISFTTAAFGFFVLPVLIMEVKYWLEMLVTTTVSDIVLRFWDLQSRKMAQVRRDKQLKKSEDAEKKLKEDISRGVLLDTSVLVDGRILEIAKTGFIDNTLIVLPAVLDELHLISDNPDPIKRIRGRKGLDVVQDLKKTTRVVFPKITLGEKGADKELIRFASAYKVKLMTMDFNLNKLAKVSGVKVLNINDLNTAVKTLVLPGEVFDVRIIDQGKEKEQGIGYTQDGTMIVVEGAKNMVGQDVKAKVAKLIQTSAGKMIFCNLV